MEDLAKRLDRLVDMVRDCLGTTGGGGAMGCGGNQGTGSGGNTLAMIDGSDASTVISGGGCKVASHHRTSILIEPGRRLKPWGGFESLALAPNHVGERRHVERRWRPRRAHLWW
jgi:hypothetical protein